MAADRDDTQPGTEVVEPSRAPAIPARSHFGLEWLAERSDRTQSWIAVSIARGGKVVTGESPSVATRRRRHGVHRAVLATLAAVETLADQPVSFELLEIGRTRTADGSWIRVGLRLWADGKVIELHGSARVAGGAAEAAALAVLDALNEHGDLLGPRAE
jgi:hypothetical protein